MANMHSAPVHSSVRLASLRARNFLSFDRNHPIDLAIRPLTLILGRNSGGKTALIRLLRLALRGIARALPTDDDQQQLGSRHLPLRIDEIVVAPSFRDMVHGRFSKEMSVGLDLEIEEGLCGYDVDLLPADAVGDRSWMVRFEGHELGENRRVELDLDATLAAQRAVYRGDVQPRFDGLREAGTLGLLHHGARILDAAVSHIGPLRARVPGAITRSAEASLGYDGAGAVQLLASRDELAARVDDWYARNLGGSRLQVRPLLDTAFEVATTSVGGTVVNLAQAGEGLHQVLPVVVQQLAHGDDRVAGPILDVVEQPELHLHDAVHAPLADLFMDTARLGRGAVVVETHSEGLLLRVRRRIAEGSFDPASLAVYFVDRDSAGSYVRAISVNADGELSDWPKGVFLEGYDEVLAIQRAIRSR